MGAYYGYAASAVVGADHSRKAAIMWRRSRVERMSTLAKEAGKQVLEIRPLRHDFVYVVQADTPIPRVSRHRLLIEGPK